MGGSWGFYLPRFHEIYPVQINRKMKYSTTFGALNSWTNPMLDFGFVWGVFHIAGKELGLLQAFYGDELILWGLDYTGLLNKSGIGS